MDDLESALTDSEESESTSKLPLIAIALGALGIIVGIVGIAMASQAKGNIYEVRSDIEAQPDKTPELESAIADIEERLVKLGSELVKLTRQDRQIRDDTQSAFDSVSKEIKNNREQLNELVTQFEEAVKEVKKVAEKTATASQPIQRNSSDSSTTAVAEDGIHRIQSGDTLSSIASKYGVSLNALMNANPTVNPRALQIGQRIVIP